MIWMATVSRLLEVLERAGIDYAVVGGLAAIAWGLPRFSQDVDLVATLPLGREDLTQLGEELGTTQLTGLEPTLFAELAFNSVERGTPLSFVTPSAVKIEIWPTGSSKAGRVAATMLNMRCRLETAGGQEAWFTTPEGTIIGLLTLYWLGSDRPMRDVASILQVQTVAGRDLNLRAIGEWAREHDAGLYQAWIEILDAVGIEQG